MNQRCSWLFMLCATCVGCSACGDDRQPLAGGGATEIAAVRSALKPKKCSPGMVAPVGFAAITEVPTLGGADAFVKDINDSGVAVGSERDVNGNMHAFSFTVLDGLVDLGSLPPFGTISFASGIAPDGAIAGHSDHGDGTGALFGYRYTPTGGRVEICPTVCSAWDVNGLGQVVGLIENDDPTTWQAFRWSAPAGLQRLGTLGGARSSASAVSETGLVTGNSQLASSAAGDVGHAFVFDTANGMRDLNTVAGAPAGWELKAANDASRTQIVGWGIHNGQTRAFLYDIRSRAVRDLGTPDGGNSFAFAVDSNGDVVGYAARDEHLNDAFLFGSNLGTRRLGEFVDPALGWDLQQASGINDQGQIVGWGYHAGLPRGYVITMPLCARGHGGGEGD